MLIKIVIHNPNSETVVHNVQPLDLNHWLGLLEECAKGIIKVYDEETGFELIPPTIHKKSDVLTLNLGSSIPLAEAA